MKAVILAGGFGTRISEETTIRPKPMVEIGDRPILWHVMKYYASYGIQEFIICCGYKGYMIKEYFANYYLHSCDLTLDLRNNKMELQQSTMEPWTITLVDTGLDSMTGGRLRRVKEYIGDETFCMTYGDGVGNVDINELIEFHKSAGTLATLTATQPPGRFGAFRLGPDQDRVLNFHEKPHGDGAWVNGGFFVLEPKVMDYIEGDSTVWEREPLERLSKEGMLSAYRHRGFWQPMDSLRDKNVLDEIWRGGNAPWKLW